MGNFPVLKLILIWSLTMARPLHQQWCFVVVVDRLNNKLLAGGLICKLSTASCVAVTNFFLQIVNSHLYGVKSSFLH